MYKPIAMSVILSAHYGKKAKSKTADGCVTPGECVLCDCVTHTHRRRLTALSSSSVIPGTHRDSRAPWLGST